MSNTPEAIKRWIRARGGVLDGEGGSGRRGTPVSSHSLSSGHWNGAFGCACVCEAKARLHRGRARLCCAGGFRHGRATAAKHQRRCLGLGVGLQPKLASVEGPGEDSGAHRGSGSKGGPAQRHRRRNRRRSSTWTGAPVPGSHGRLQGDPAMVPRGQRGSGSGRRRGKSAAEPLTGDASLAELQQRGSVGLGFVEKLGW